MYNTKSNDHDENSKHLLKSPFANLKNLFKRAIFAYFSVPIFKKKKHHLNPQIKYIFIIFIVPTHTCIVTVQVVCFGHGIQLVVYGHMAITLWNNRLSVSDNCIDLSPVIVWPLTWCGYHGLHTYTGITFLYLNNPDNIISRLETSLKLKYRDTQSDLCSVFYGGKTWVCMSMSACTIFEGP